jgi:hypothetical protein
MDVRYFPWKTREIFKGGTATTVKKSPSDRLYTAQTGSTAAAADYFKWAATPQKLCLPTQRKSKPKFYFHLFQFSKG